MIQVRDNQIIQYNLPTVGKLKDGRTVSGYNLLDKEILKEEGWLPLEDNKPEYNPKTHFLQDEGYKILEDRVLKKYRVVEISKDSENISQEELIEIKQALEILLGGE